MQKFLFGRDAPRRYSVAMDTPPQSPFKLNRTRIFILAMIALALATILGTTLGGSLTGYQQLREAATPAEK